MDVAGWIPTPDALPVHWGWIKALLLLTFTLHLLLMNLMLGGSLLAVAGRLRGGRIPNETRSLPILIALTVNLGVPPLLFLQTLYGHMFYTSTVLMAFFWLGIVPTLIAAYFLAYGFVHRHHHALPGHGALCLGLAAVLLLLVGFMLTNTMTLMVRPERWGVYFERPNGTFLNLSEPTLFPRYLHFVVASIAVAALGRAGYHAVAARRARRDPGPVVPASLRLFAWTTMVQVAIGVWFWLTLPGSIGRLFLGGGGWHTLLMAAGILLALAVIFTALRARLWLTGTLALALVVTMVLVRDLVRAAYLDPYTQPSALPIEPQPGPMLWFFLAFVAVGAILFIILRTAWQSTRPGEGAR